MLCPFLTTDKENIECFSDCAFYEHDMKDGKCPFRNSTKLKGYKIFYDKNFGDDEFQEHEKYIKEMYTENY
ncbi:hypothetical protein [Clostridium sp. KNHs214]|uniref:hypothetical protein n=1 Tax=Clostridium sp. KNHs214 TaxID=1540257 RepID=UPI0005507678|nr:hypothetical protein [Clostridium sp. KNHs214]